MNKDVSTAANRRLVDWVEQYVTSPPSGSGYSAGVQVSEHLSISLSPHFILAFRSHLPHYLPQHEMVKLSRLFKNLVNENLRLVILVFLKISVSWA